jgi:hypothetical protein
MDVFRKLLVVQSELKAPKGQYNSFGKYKYRSCEDIMEAVKPILAKVNAVILLNDEIVEVSGRFYVKATARFIDCEGGGFVEANAFAREDESKKGMDGAQVTGATSSYARKYALNGLLAIDDTNDADATNTHGGDPESKPAVPQEKQQKKPAAIICERCKDQVKPGKTKEGNLWGVADMVKYSKLRFKGAIYCQDCMKAAFEAEQVAAEAAAQ